MKNTTIHLEMTHSILEGGGKENKTIEYPTQALKEAEIRGNVLEELSEYMFADVNKADYNLGISNDTLSKGEAVLAQEGGRYTEFVTKIAKYLHSEGILTSMAISVMFGEDGDKGMKREQLSDLVEGICKNNNLIIKEYNSNGMKVYTLNKY